MKAKTKTRINPLLSGEIALTQAETALILGCRARDVQQHLLPDFMNGRPKYIARRVLELRDKWIRETKKIQDNL